MELKNEINIGGVHIMFQISLQVGIITTLPPTEFTKNYLEILIKMAGEHFTKQMAESMIERLQEDFPGHPKEVLWQKQS